MENKAKYPLIFSVVIVVLAGLSAAFLAGTGAGLSGFGVASIGIFYPNGTEMAHGNVYVANTIAQQARGFQNAPKIGDCNGKGNCIGMLFIFNSTQQQCMWMHDTVMPLEQEWIAANGTVIGIHHGEPLSSNVTCFYARYVLETNATAGIATGYGIRFAQ